MTQDRNEYSIDIGVFIELAATSRRHKTGGGCKLLTQF